MSDQEQRAGISRRDAFKLFGVGAMGLGASYGVTPETIERFRRAIKGGQYEYEFFSATEVSTMRVLADMIIPADDRSGSATDAGTVEYVDFVLSESNDENQARWHDGIAWLDAESRRRFADTRFVECTQEQRGTVVDLIGWPERAAAAYEDQVRWFNSVRDLVGSGFFSSALGVRDVGYQGGIFNPTWRGAPQEALDELGVSYDEWDRKYGGRQ